MKLLLWLVVGLVIVAWLMRGKKSLKSPESTRQPEVAAVSESKAEPMVQCAHCGIHLPVSESLVDPKGTAFCCEEHRHLHV
jgi:uncharacterized protein